MKKIVEEIQTQIDRFDLIIGHNIKFDLHWLKSIGIRTPKVFDTMVMEYLLRGQDSALSYSLAETATRYGLKPKLDLVKQYWDSGVDTANVPLDVLTEYCIHDTRLAYELYLLQEPEIRKLGMAKLARLHNLFVECLQEIEGNGMRVDTEYLEKSKYIYKERMESLRVDLQMFIQDYFNTDFVFNLSSNDHLSVILYGGNLPIEGVEEYEVTLKSGEVKTKSRKKTYEIHFKGLGFKPSKKDACKKEGFYKTNKDVLNTLKASTKAQRFFIETVMELSKVEKIYTTYLEGMEKFITKEGMIHPNFNQALTVTGRLSSSKPNFQNLPRGKTDEVAKRLFIPRSPDRLIVNGDLSALEWCVGAQLSGDKTMIEEIENDVDIHTANSLAIFGSESFRQESKTISFRSLYGGSAYAFFMDANMPKKTLEEWEDIHAKFYQKYNRLGLWQKENYRTVCEQGWYSSFTGRRYVFHKQDGVYSKPAVCNYIVQGTATGDIVPFAMMLIRKKIRDEELDARMICQVHDSGVLDVQKDYVDRVAEVVHNVFGELPKTIKQYWGYDWIVPMTGEIEVGHNYKDLTKIFGKKGRI